ncbi:conjugative transposon protein TraM [Hoylesella timonensis]|uniref:conjugative transposon protein TraM n=1 Tax=Hoylesella timonensis TaxID=386414 RepID=UPI003F49236C
MPQSSSTTNAANAFTPAKEKGVLETSATKQVSVAGFFLQWRYWQNVSRWCLRFNQPMTDADFVQQYGTKPRNMGFHSLTSAVAAVSRNTLSVVVDRTATLKEGDNVALRMLETAQVQGLRIPRQSRLIARAKIEGNRLHLLVKSIEVKGRIIAVKLSAYDTDGQEGVFIPGSEDINALKEVGANIGGSMGTSFTFASSAKDQIISEAARGVMQGASQLLQKKLRTVKVTLKGGYRMFLVQSK